MYYLKCLIFYLYLAPAITAAFIMVLFRWGNIDSNRLAAQWFAWGILKVWGVRIEVENEERLLAHQPCVYVANHQGAMDVPIFGWIFPLRTVVVGKKELLWIPIFNLFFIAAGNIALNRQARSRAVSHLGEAVQAMKKRGSSIWIFPEGTRNRSGEPLLPFKKGAFYMAIQAQVPVVPVVAERMQPFFDSHHRVLRGGTFRVKILPPISTAGLDESRIGELTDRVREKMLEAFLSLAAESPPSGSPAVRP